MDLNSIKAQEIMADYLANNCEKLNNLAFVIARSKGIQAGEDEFQNAFFYLREALMKYDETKNDSFDKYCNMVISNRFKDTLNAQKYQCREVHRHTCSFNEPSDIDPTMTYEEILPDKYSTEDIVIIRERRADKTYLKFINSAQQKKFIELKLQGLGKKEICEIMQITAIRYSMIEDRILRNQEFHQFLLARSCE